MILEFGAPNVILNTDIARPEPGDVQLVRLTAAAGVGPLGRTDSVEGVNCCRLVGTLSSLDEARTAHEMRAGAVHKRGKVVLKVAPDRCFDRLNPKGHLLHLLLTMHTRISEYEWKE